MLSVIRCNNNENLQPVGQKNGQWLKVIKILKREIKIREKTETLSSLYCYVSTFYSSNNNQDKVINQGKNIKSCTVIVLIHPTLK